MGVRRERIMNGLTWLVLLLTPLTGVPHFVCRCPNGRVKPYCLGCVSKTTGCCCGCSCCRRSSDAKRCCCHAGGASSTQCPSAEPSPDSHCSAGRSGCTKTLAEQAVFTPRGEQTARDVSLDEATLPASLVPLNPLIKGGKDGSSHPGHSLAPPVDLVTLLGRLLI